MQQGLGMRLLSAFFNMALVRRQDLVVNTFTFRIHPDMEKQFYHMQARSPWTLFDKSQDRAVGSYNKVHVQSPYLSPFSLHCPFPPSIFLPVDGFQYKSQQRWSQQGRSEEQFSLTFDFNDVYLSD